MFRNKNKINKNDILLDLLIDRKYRFLRHIFTVVVVMACFGLLGAFKDPKEHSGYYDLAVSLFTGILFLSMLYANLYFLMAKLIVRKRYLSYVFSTVVLMSAVFGILKFFIVVVAGPHRIEAPQQEVPVIIEFAVVFFLLIPPLLCSTALKLFQMWAIENERIAVLEKKAHASELDALRNQINPHFLFNMLNNINTLIYTKPDVATQIVVKLSDFLRHLLYENAHQKVFLASEVKFLDDFLKLESIRRDNFTYEIGTDANCSRGIQIPPNIFITFVENAVKHSRDTSAATYVRISLAADANMLFFTVSNTKPKHRKPRQESGLGLANIKRRLELLYNHNYDLEILENEVTYTLNLKLPI